MCVEKSYNVNNCHINMITYIDYYILENVLIKLQV